MGPYCKFCNDRCFMPITNAWPEHIASAYGTATIAATCSQGQNYELEKIGVCYNTFVEFQKLERRWLAYNEANKTDLTLSEYEDMMKRLSSDPPQVREGLADTNQECGYWEWVNTERERLSQ